MINNTFSDFNVAQPFTYSAVLTNIKQIYDGDTISRVEIDLGFRVRVKETLRLIGIDTPELRGDDRLSGLVSRDWLREQIPIGKSFLIRTQKGTGKYGRWLAEVSIDGRNLNQEMITNGMAKEYWP